MKALAFAAAGALSLAAAPAIAATVTITGVAPTGYQYGTGVDQNNVMMSRSTWMPCGGINMVRA